MTNSTNEHMTKEVYLTPTSRLIEMNLENAVCGSPLPGGNEDIGYDDEW